MAASLEGRPVSVASATDHLFILLCHAFEDDIERRNDWIADLDLLFRLVPPEEWDWRLFHRLAREHQLDRWIRKALATMQAVTGRPPPSGAFTLLGAAPTWRGVLQNREIGLRGLPASSCLRPQGAFERPQGARLCRASDRSLSQARARRRARARGPASDRGQNRAPAEVRVSRHNRLSRRLVVTGGRMSMDRRRTSACSAFPLPLGKAGEPFQMRMRLAALPELRQPAEGAGVGRRPRRNPGFRKRSGGGSLRRERSAVAADGRPGRRRSACCGCVWTACSPRMNASPSTIFSRRGVRADYIEALLTSEVAARLPMLDRPLPLGGPESDVMAWTGWGAPEGFGRWTVGTESRLRFRRPAEKGGTVNAVAIDVAQVFSAGGPVVFEVQVGSEAPGRFQFPEASGIARGAGSRRRRDGGPTASRRRSGAGRNQHQNSRPGLAA